MTKKFIASHINTELHAKLKTLAKKEGISICAVLEKLVEQFVEGKILLSDSHSLFAKTNVPEIQEIIEDTNEEISEPVIELETKDKELSLIENIETNLLEIKTKLEDLENKVNSQSKLSSDEVKLELIKSLIFK